MGCDYRHIRRLVTSQRRELQRQAAVYGYLNTADIAMGIDEPSQSHGASRALLWKQTYTHPYAIEAHASPCHSDQSNTLCLQRKDGVTGAAPALRLHRQWTTAGTQNNGDYCSTIFPSMTNIARFLWRNRVVG